MNRTEALRQAVEHVYSGAERIDAECIEDHLADLGFKVVQMSGARAASMRRRDVELPLADGSQPRELKEGAIKRLVDSMLSGDVDAIGRNTDHLLNIVERESS